MMNYNLVKIIIVLIYSFLFGTNTIYCKNLNPIQQNNHFTSIGIAQKASLADKSSSDVIFYNASEFEITGKLPQTNSYSRLPEAAKNKVRDPVWNLSTHTAGISIRFASNTTSVNIRWTLKNNSALAHMTAIASRGFDLYAYVNNKWQFVGVARPQNSKTNQATIIEGMFKEDREYLLNLPLYDGLELVEIGIDQNAYIKKPIEQIIDKTNPIVFYGTSITQGASASRPGLTYPSLTQRNLNREVINLGFSGNCRFEKAVAAFFMSADPGIIILDCTPNSPADTIRKNLPELVDYIRSINDTVPVIFIESIMRDFAYFKKEKESNIWTQRVINEQNKALHAVYEDKKRKYNHLYYLKSDMLIGNDHEATIDGVHFNDLGNFRAYEKILRVITEIIR